MLQCSRSTKLEILDQVVHETLMRLADCGLGYTEINLIVFSMFVATLVSITLAIVSWFLSGATLSYNIIN